MPSFNNQDSSVEYVYRRRFKRKSAEQQSKAMIRSVLTNEVAEKKYLTATSNDSISANGTVTSLTDVGVGDTDVQREGNEITISSMYLSWVVAASDVYNCVRIIVFQWLPNTAALAPAANLILETTASVISPISSYRHNTRKLYRILADETVCVNSASKVSVAGSILVTQFPHRDCQFEDASTSGKNKIFMLTISDSTAVTHPTMEWCSKLTFRDV